jgi:hypothetical protein
MQGMAPLIHQHYGLCELNLFFASPAVLSLIPLRNLCSGYLMIIFQLHVLRRTNQGGRGDGGAGCIGKSGSLYKILVTISEGKVRLVVLGLDGKIKLTKVKKVKLPLSTP